MAYKMKYYYVPVVRQVALDNLLYSATWPSLPKKHFNGLINQSYKHCNCVQIINNVHVMRIFILNLFLKIKLI